MQKGYYQETDLIGFAKRFPDEESCRRHLFWMRWPGGFVCARCSGVHYYDLPKRGLYQCKLCGYQASLTSGTVMHRTRTPLLKWFWALLLVGQDKRGVSALSLSKKISVSYWVAWSMLGKIRNAMGDRDAHYKLAGLIQVDDSYFGGKPNGDSKTIGRGTKKTPVLVEVSIDETGKPRFAKMRVLESVKGCDITKHLMQDVLPGQTIQTDGWQAYQSVGRSGFRHQPRVVYGPKGCGSDTILRWAHILISNAKTFIRGTYHGLGLKHLGSYLDEFCYRLNRRFCEPELFDRLLFACVTSKGITYSELTQ